MSNDKFRKVENNSILQLGEWMRDWRKFKTLFLEPNDRLGERWKQPNVAIRLNDRLGDRWKQPNNVAIRLNDRLGDRWKQPNNVAIRLNDWLGCN
jgi:hypothetical protein